MPRRLPKRWMEPTSMASKSRSTKLGPVTTAVAVDAEAADMAAVAEEVVATAVEEADMEVVDTEEVVAAADTEVAAMAVAVMEATEVADTEVAAMVAVEEDTEVAAMVVAVDVAAVDMVVEDTKQYHHPLCFSSFEELLYCTISNFKICNACI